MPSDHNPWNLPGNGGNRPRVPDTGPPWGGPPRGPRPPDFDHLAASARDFLHRFLEGGPRALALAGIIVAVVWMFTGIYRVQPDELGLVSRFGAYTRSTPPGLNWHIPWPIESVQVLAVTRINRVEIGFRSAMAEEDVANPHTASGGAADADRPEAGLRQESLMLTGDENIVDINVSVFWRVLDAAAYAFNTRNQAITVKSAAESVLRQVIGHTDIQSALTGGRAAIEEAVTTGTQKILDQYGTGIEITQVQLQKVDPPADVIESFRDVQRANTDADRAQKDAQAYSNDIVPRARGDAAAILAQASGDKQAAIATANGQSQRFLSVYAAYTQAREVTLKRLYIETMQELLSHSDTTVIDDRLRGLVPLLSLNPGRTPELPEAPK
ncbi:MAG: FtsH protease activity modulator HflK [Rhodospirillales bacterium]